MNYFLRPYVPTFQPHYHDQFFDLMLPDKIHKELKKISNDIATNKIKNSDLNAKLDELVKK